MTPDRRPSVLSVFSSFGVGGPQVRFAAFAQHLGAACRHAVIAMDGDLRCASRLPPALEVGYPACHLRKGDLLANLWAMRATLRQLRPDVLVTSNWGSIEWAIANIPPLVRHVHFEDGFGPEERSGQIRRRVLARRALLRRSIVVVPSRTLHRLAVDTWRLPPRRVRYVPNGIDLSRFAPARPGGEAGGDPVIGTVAALRPEKNLGRLLHAFHIVSRQSPARLVIAGDGPERPGLEALAAQLGLRDRVAFIGHAADPAPLYAGFDIFALSSDTEQMPLSVLEAMAAGLPVAATDVGDVRGMLSDGNAAFAGARDAGHLARDLLGLLGDAALRQRLGAANRLKAEQSYDQETMFASYRALLDVPA